MDDVKVHPMDVLDISVDALQSDMGVTVATSMEQVTVASEDVGVETGGEADYDHLPVHPMDSLDISVDTSQSDMGVTVTTSMEQVTVASEDVGIETGGEVDYNRLHNKPQINEVTLQGNKPFREFGVQPEEVGVYEMTAAQTAALLG